MKFQSRVIGCYNDGIALKFDRHLGGDWKSLNNKNHRVGYSVKPETPKKSLSRKLLSVRRTALMISEEFWFNRIPNECGFYFYPVISWIHIFMGNCTCSHIAIVLRFSTSDLLCLNIHLNCLSLDNHLVSRQLQWQCHVTMIWQWGHATKQIFNLLDGAKLEGIKRNDLTIIWAWYDHHLLTYTFLCPWHVILCTNDLFKANGDQFSVWRGAILRGFPHSENRLRVSRVLTHKNQW